MAGRFQGTRTTKPAGQEDKMPKGPDNRYFPWKYAHPEDSWECIPDPFWSPPVDPKDKNKALPPKKASSADKKAAESWGVRTDHPWCWVPRVKTFAMQPGINGVRLGKKGGGTPRTRQAVANAEEDHGLFCIPYESYPDGYIVQYPTGHKGARAFVYADVWTEILEIRGRKGGKQTFHKFNSPECPALLNEGITFDMWRASLVKNGYIKAPTHVGVDFAIDVQGARANRNVRHEATNPHYAYQGEKERYKLRMMMVAPLPKRTKRKGVKAKEEQSEAA